MLAQRRLKPWLRAIVGGLFLLLWYSLHHPFVVVDPGFPTLAI